MVRDKESLDSHSLYKHYCKYRASRPVKV